MTTSYVKRVYNLSVTFFLIYLFIKGSIYLFIYFTIQIPDFVCLNPIDWSLLLLKRDKFSKHNMNKCVFKNLS